MLRKVFLIAVLGTLFSLGAAGIGTPDAMAACEVVADAHGGPDWYVCNSGAWAMELWIVLLFLAFLFF